MSALNLPQTAGKSRSARRTRLFAKATSQPSLPFNEPSFSDPQNEENSCIYRGLGVEYAHKNNGSAGCANTQLSLFNHSVMSHDMADASSLCLSTLGESKRRMMKAREAKGLQ